MYPRQHCKNNCTILVQKITILEVLMRKRTNTVLYWILVLSITFIVIGCASGPKGPQLGSPTQLQQTLNRLPAVPVAGNNLKFEFFGDAWIAKNNGVNFIGGTVVSEDNDDGSILNLTQTHTYSTQQKPGVGGNVGWVKTPGPAIVLVYNSTTETLETK
jgi:hypothetical protein